MPFQISILCYDNHVSDFGQTVPCVDPHTHSGRFMPGIFRIKEASVSDSTEEVPMTPGVIAQQNGRNDQGPIMNFQGLTQSPSPWDESAHAPGEEKKDERERRSKREMLAQQQREEQERRERRGESDRKYQSYMAAVAAEELRSRTSGEPMDPESMISMLHTGMDAMTGGGASAISGITMENAAKGEDGGHDQEEEDLPASPLHQPLRND